VDDLEPGGAGLKIFDGFEEIEILPWHVCKDCAKHSHFSGRLSAQLFLQRFKSHPMALDSLRGLIRERREGLCLPKSFDDEVLEQVAQMLATGELHVIRNPIILGTGAAKPSAQKGRPQAQAAPSPPPRRPAEGPPPPPPEESVFLPNVDPVAMAQALSQAALSGAPFCEE
jgi:hypothetical protein